MSASKTQQTPHPATGVHPRVALTVNVLGAVLGPAIGAIGLSVSFQTLSDLATRLALPGPACLYPLGIDLGILALILADWMYAIRGRNGWPLRVLAWSLTAFTVWANAHGTGDVPGLPASDAAVQTGMHAVMPLLWVVMVEAARRLILDDRREADGTKIDSIPVIRWILAPLRTLLVYRRMRLWGLTSYPLALALEDARLHGLDLVRAEHGTAWRFRTPRVLRVRLTGGRLPGPVRETVSALVGAGRDGGWEPVVQAWIHSVLTPPQHTPATAPADVPHPSLQPCPQTVVERVPATSPDPVSDAAAHALAAVSPAPPARPPLPALRATPDDRAPRRPGGTGRAPSKRSGKHGPRVNTRTATPDELDAATAQHAAIYEAANGGSHVSARYLKAHMGIGHGTAKELIDRHYAQQATPLHTVPQ